jgi:hypothetical protein
MRERFIVHPKTGELIPRSRYRRAPDDTKRVHVISDTMDPQWHPAAGRTYDSKSKFRNETRARGLEEVGTSRFEPPREMIDRAGIREAIQRAFGDA